MSYIHVLDEPTINQIAAGEVVERPSAVVKELIENAIDAGATAITAEIKEGGLSLIRITDNGAGIAKEDIPLAFLRHATSKILTAEDLLTVTSLGFRGEALSSISAVSQVELITKTPSLLNGYRYIIEGGEEKSLEEIGCPSGTTILVRNIFYNTPARRKFLKSAGTEAGYISDLMQRIIVSHPDISFKFIINNQVKLQSSGNNNSKDILYHVYGRDITKELLPVNYNSEEIKISGFIGKPLINRGNRNFENYFINGRYIKSNAITKAIEEAYKPFLMQHKYPFTSLYLVINPSLIDVNVHPQKMEVRLKNSEEVYQVIRNVIFNTLSGKEMIPQFSLSKHEEIKKEEEKLPEPFEENRRKQFLPSSTSVKEDSKIKNLIHEKSGYQISNVSEDNVTNSDGASSELNVSVANIKKIDGNSQETNFPVENINNKEGIFDGSNLSVENIKNIEENSDESNLSVKNFKNKEGIFDGSNLSVENIEYTKKPSNASTEQVNTPILKPEQNNISNSNISIVNTQTNVVKIASEQMNLFATSEADTEAPFLSKKAMEEHRIIGQIFSTYWLVEYKKELFIIDQHAAHEKVLYEKIMTAATSKTYASQLLLPPIVLTLTLREQEVLVKYEEVLNNLGYEFEPFGGNEYSFRAVPADLYGLSEKELMLEFLDDLTDDFNGNMISSSSILERVASFSCKAAVKANHNFSHEEATALIKELLTLSNPYHCPHGRPVIISMSQYELEKKFKRIL